MKGKILKRTDIANQSEPPKKTPHCILHTISIEHGPFTTMLNLVNKIMFYIISMTDKLFNLWIQLTNGKGV